MHRKCALPVFLMACTASLLAQGPPNPPGPPPGTPGRPGARVIVKPDIVIFTAVPGVTLPSRPIRIQRTGPPAGNLTYSAVVSTQSGGNWLSASPLSGPISGSMTLTAIPGTLAPGTYTGRVTVTPSPAGSTPQVVNVTLRVNPAAGSNAAFVRPGSVSFQMAEGATNPEPRALTVSGPGNDASFPWTASRTITTPAGGNWLSVTPASGAGAGSVTVAANGVGLAPGSYSGSVTVTTGATSTVVPVALEIRAAAAAGLVIHPRAFNFIVHPGGGAPAPRTLEVKNRGSGSLNWSATSTGNWLSISPSSGTAPSSITLRANATGLARGHYEGSVRVSAGGETPTARVFLRIVGPPAGTGGPGPSPGPGTTTTSGALQISPASVAFTSSGAAVTPATAAVRLTSGITGLSFAAAATTARGGNWLSVTPASGTVPATINISAMAVGLAEGLYSGSINITVSGTASERRTIPVTLQVSGTGQPRLRASPESVILRATAGGPSPVSTTVSLEAGASPISYRATWSALWLSATPASGTTPALVSISANTTGLAAGTYNSSVLFSAAPPEAAAPTSLPVSLIVSAPGASGARPLPAIASEETTLRGYILQPAPEFLATAGLALEVRALVVNTAGVPVEGAEVRVSSSNGEPTLLLDDLGGGVYGGLFRSLAGGPVALSATALHPESGARSALFAAGGDLDGSPEIIPFIYQDGAVSAASFADGVTPIAPGSLLSIFGRDLALDSAAASALPLPRSLAGVRVLIGGIEAALLAVVSGADGQDQINLQVPFELAGLSFADLVVEQGGFLSAPQSLRLAPALPALFTTTQDGRGAAAVLHADFRPVTQDNAARGGETILLFATGLGDVAGAATGAAARGEMPVTGNVTATIGGMPARVVFAGLAPGFAGLYQVNLVVPDGLAPGDAPIVVLVDGVGSGEGATIRTR